MRSRTTLAVVAVAQFLIALDYSIIQVALPRIAADLRLDATSTPWIISAYAVMFAGFLVVGGRLADRFGARPVFTWSVLAFGAASAAGAVAGNAAFLLIARGGQGIAAAVLQPAVLGLIGTTFPAGPARARALAVWGSVGASGLAAGTLLGGALTELSWRLTFLVNVPITLTLAVIGRASTAVISFPTPSPAGRLPLRSAATATGAVLTLLTALTLAGEDGWSSPATLVPLAISVALAVVFVVCERPTTDVAASREARPGPTADFRKPDLEVEVLEVEVSVLVPHALRDDRCLRVGAVAAALYMASVGAEFFLLTLLLQAVDGYSPLRTGLAFLPLAASVTVGSSIAGRRLRHRPAPTVLAGGFALSAAGLAWIAAAPGGYLAGLLPGLLASGIGHGTVYTSMFTLGTGGAPREHQGTAGALMTTAQYVAGAIAVALLTLLLGAGPGRGDFRVAFAATAAAAVAGAALAVRALRAV